MIKYCEIWEKFDYLFFKNLVCFRGVKKGNFFFSLLVKFFLLLKRRRAWWSVMCVFNHLQRCSLASEKTFAGFAQAIR
jgi:hypothetical protein